MADRPDAYEQLMLELINRARLDPTGEFSRLIVDPVSRTGATPQITSALNAFNVDMAALKQALSGMTAASALAWSDTLSTAATAHSQQMIAYNAQAHILPGEADPGSRVLAAGYGFSTLGENIFAYGQDALYSHAAFMIDWGNGPNGMQNPAGHRINIMDWRAQEIGIGVIAENNPFTSVGSQVITEDIGSRSGYQAQLLGVVINDINRDHFYGIGEGLGGITVTATGTAGTFTTTTWDAGGYQMILPTGSYRVHFSGSGVDWTTSIVMGTNNLKLDAEAGVFNNTATLPDAGGSTANASAIFYDAPMTQWLTGSTSHDVFVIDDISSVYGNARTQDGSGVVVWKGAKFDILNGFETLRFLDREVQVGSDGLFNLTSASGVQGREVVFLDAPMTQWLTGSGSNDVFVIDDISSVYGNSRTLDGSGVVVWKGAKFDILNGFETLRFLDRDVKVGSNGLFDLSLPSGVGGTGETFFQNLPGTQWLYGTGNKDVYVVNASSLNYGFGRTLDGTGIVVWTGSDFDILTGFETIRFTDHDVSVASIV